MTYNEYEFTNNTLPTNIYLGRGKTSAIVCIVLSILFIHSPAAVILASFSIYMSNHATTLERDEDRRVALILAWVVMAIKIVTMIISMISLSIMLSTLLEPLGVSSLSDFIELIKDSATQSINQLQ